MPKNGFEKKYFDQLPNIVSPFKKIKIKKIIIIIIITGFI